MVFLFPKSFFTLLDVNEEVEKSELDQAVLEPRTFTEGHPRDH